MTLRSGGHHKWHRRSKDNYRPSSSGPVSQALTFEGCGKREESLMRQPARMETGVMR